MPANNEVHTLPAPTSPFTPMNDPIPRVRLRPIVFGVAVTIILLLLAGPFVAAAYVFTIAPVGLGIAALVGAVVIAGVSGRVMARSVHWVELDGDVIRERRLLTRKIVEHRVEEIVDARPIHTDYLGTTQNAVLDFLLDTSNRGYQLFFRDGSRLALIRVDMSGLDPFLEALAEQLRKTREGDSVG
jgi:hypothetical protein